MKFPVYNFEKKEIKQIDLPEKIFGLEPNLDLIYQVSRILQLRLKKPIAHAKGRGEVSGGGKKPRPQKGSGRSRQGSIRSPLWKGGGVTHGPLNERNYDLKINKKMKQKALLEVLSSKAKNGFLTIVSDDFSLREPKTKYADKLLRTLVSEAGRPRRSLLVNDFSEKSLARSFYNLPYLKVIGVKNINILDLLNFPVLLITESGVKNLIAFIGKENK